MVYRGKNHKLCYYPNTYGLHCISKQTYSFNVTALCTVEACFLVNADSATALIPRLTVSIP